MGKWKEKDCKNCVHGPTMTRCNVLEKVDFEVIGTETRCSRMKPKKESEAGR